MLAGTPILVSAAHGEHHGAVRRDAQGDLWISHWIADRPERVAGTRLEGREPARIGVRGSWIVGGRLPNGVAKVQARGESGTWHAAALGNGAWVGFVDGREHGSGLPPIRMLDGDGEIVSRAAPGAIDTARRLTAQEADLIAMGPGELGGACPVCETDDWRAAPAPAGSLGERIFCARCGHSDGAARGFWSPGA